MRKFCAFIAIFVCGDVKASPQHHTFAAGDRTVTIDVRSFDPYRGNRLV